MLDAFPPPTAPAAMLDAWYAVKPDKKHVQLFWKASITTHFLLFIPIIKEGFVLLEMLH